MADTACWYHLIISFRMGCGCIVNNRIMCCIVFGLVGRFHVHGGVDTMMLLVKGQQHIECNHRQSIQHQMLIMLASLNCNIKSKILIFFYFLLFNTLLGPI